MDNTRPWAWFFENAPLTVAGLAAAMGCTRISLYNLRTGEHLRAPVHLLGELARVLRKHGMVDGSEPPDRAELVRSWRQQWELAQ
jgi:hypothetical protein